MAIIKEVKLPTGAELKIQLPPFSVSKDLYQSLLREAKGVAIRQDTDMGDLYKNLFCIGFSSKEIDAALDKCFEHCLYENLRIDANTFEPEKAREDYIQVCVEVVKANIAPFMKSLYSEYKRALEVVTTSTPK